MNIKSLLLGSAAALAVVSGAQAADAIVAAEPEPMEYVRVCDAFGTGYFYIPGTETCLKIGGYVRQDIRGGDALGFDTDRDGRGDAWNYRTRFTLRVSTAADTEYGALKTFSEVRFNYRNDQASPNSTALQFAYIDLAGFRVGRDDSVFISYPGYAGTVLSDDLIDFGTDEVQLISYTYDAGNGFTAVISAEDDNGRNGDYMPNLVAGAGYKADNFGFKVVGAYDDAADEGAIKARADAKFGSLALFVMAGYNTGDVKNFYADWNGDWAVWGGGSYKFNDKIKTNVQLSYTESEDFAAVANVSFTVVKDFVITPEVVYTDNLDTDGDDEWGGMVRLQRSF